MATFETAHHAQVAAACRGFQAGLVAHYKLDDIGEPLVIDSTGSYNGTNFGAARDANGRIGRAFTFDGNDHVDTGFGDGVSNPNGISIALWVKSTDSTDSGLVVSRASPAAQLTGIRAGLGQGIPCLNLSGTSANICASNTINDNTWHHIVATHYLTQPYQGRHTSLEITPMPLLLNKR